MPKLIVFGGAKLGQIQAAGQRPLIIYYYTDSKRVRDCPCLGQV